MVLFPKFYWLLFIVIHFLKYNTATEKSYTKMRNQVLLCISFFFYLTNEPIFS